MRIARRLLWGALVAALILGGWRFASQNEASVPIDLVIARVPDTPLWVGLVCAFAGGALVAGVLCLYQILKLGLLARRYRRTVVRLESEIHQLRNLPLVAEEAEPPLAAGGSVGPATGGDG